MARSATSSSSCKCVPSSDYPTPGAFAEARVYSPQEAELVPLKLEKCVGDAGKHVLCPIPGLLRDLPVLPGQVVEIGEALALVEAMKMENVIRAERDGTAGILHAKAGDSLGVDAVILDFA